jgi:uncharacterized phage protein gp47/JayE
MTIYGVTATGFVIKPLSIIQTEIDDAQRAATDPGLDLDARSTLGQINGVMSGKLAEVWELGQATYNATYPDSASDDSLDNVSSLTGTTRSQATKTIVRDVSVTLSPNSPLPLGSVANLNGQPNARYVSLAVLPGSPTGGVFTVDFEAEQTGSDVVTIGELDSIAEPVTGWTAVNNTLDGETGTSTETDSGLRTKRLDELESTGSTNVDAIRAALTSLASVTDALVFENDTDFIDGEGRPPHSVHAVLRGGTPTEVANAIFVEKAGGIETFGAQSLAVLDSMGFSHTIKWDDGVQLLFYGDIDVTIDPLVFDVIDGPDAIKAAIAAYVNSLKIGSDVIYDLCKAVVLPVAVGCGVPGVLTIPALQIGFGVADQTIDLPVAITEYATSDVANITVTVI